MNIAKLARRLFSVTLMAALSASAAEWSYTESGNVQLPEVAENTTLMISSGVTVTNTTALIGARLLTVQGGGTLYLTQNSPDFSGGLYIGKATVAPTVSGALGTGAVTIQGKTIAGGTSRLMFANGSSEATFVNDILVESSGTSGSSTANFYFPGPGKVTLTGDIDATSIDTLMIQDGFASNVTTVYAVFTGTISCKNRLSVYGRALCEFQGAVFANQLYPYASAGTGSAVPKLTLSSSENRIGSLYQRKGTVVNFKATNAAGGAKLTIGQQGYHLYGNDQIVAYMANDADHKDTSFVNGDSEATVATLTLTGGVAQATMYGLLKNKLSLVIDDRGATGDFVQVQTNGTHTMSGPLVVKRGTYAIRGTATYKSVPSVSVAGGTLDLGTTAASPFAGVTNLSVGASGTLRVAPNVAWPFANNKTVNVAFVTGASYEGDEIEIQAKSLTVDGEAVPAGIWTHEDYAAIPDGITVSMVTKKIELTESGEIDFAGTYGSVDGFWSVHVPAGVTVTNMTALAATSADDVVEIVGGGTFVQLASSPAFASEIRIGKASVVVAADAALGTGDVVISGYSKAGGTSQLVFEPGTEGFSVSNDIAVLSSGASEESKAPILFSISGGCTRFVGDIDATGVDLYVVTRQGSSSTRDIARFDGDVRANDLQVSRGLYHFYGSVEVSGELYAYGNANAGDARITSYAHLYHADNRIGALRMRKSSTIDAHAANAFGGASLTLGQSGYHLNGCDQVVAYVANDGDLKSTSFVDGDSEATVATLTLTGGVAQATMCGLFKNKLSLEIDDRGEAGDFVQVVSNGVNTMSGAVVVRRGTLALKGKTQFTSATNLVVSGGTLSLATEEPTFGTAKSVATRKLTLTLDPAATVSIAEDLTVNVNRLWIGESGQKAGDYTGVGGPTSATVLPQLSGTGVLHVNRSSGQGAVLVVR